MLSKFYLAATIMVAVSFWFKPVFGQGFYPLSKHSGKIEKVLVTIDFDDINQVLLYDEDSTNLVRILLCTFHDYNISSCLIFKKQIQVCKPVKERPSFMAQLREEPFANPQFDNEIDRGKWSEKIEKLNDLNAEIQRLEKKVLADKNLHHVDLDVRFWNPADTMDLSNPQIQIIGKTAQWYDDYLQLLEDVFVTNWELINETDSVAFCQANRSGSFSLIRHCESKAYSSSTTLGSSWSQDEYLVFTNDSLNVVAPRLTTPLRYGDLLSRLSQAPCSLQIDSTSPLDIQGGNMLVSGPYALIGMDVLKEWYSVYDGIAADDKRMVISRLEHIGLDTSATEFMITSKLDSILGKKVIWIGGKEPYWNYFREESSNMRDYGYGYQPVWHIDLFLHPISFVNTNGRSTMKLLVGMPDEKWQLEEEMSKSEKYSRKQIIEGLKKKINESISTLMKDLQKDSVDCDTVHIPLPLKFKRENLKEIYDYFSYCNGLVHHTDTQSVFFSPQWSKAMLKYRFASPKIHDTIKNKLKRAGLTYVGIEADSEWETGALHCKVLVTERSQ